MKKIILSVVMVFALVATSCNNNPKNAQVETVVGEQVSDLPGSGTYNAEASSVVEWKGSKPTGNHTGTIGLQSGTFTIENGKVTGNFVIDINSITVTDLDENSGKANLEAHLKGTGKEEGEDHFFNVKKYPTGTFTLTAFDGTNVTGDLTLKGKTKTISFPATLTLTDSELSLESKPFEINRVDFGINYGSKSIFDDLKDNFINDEIELVVKVNAKK